MLIVEDPTRKCSLQQWTCCCFTLDTRYKLLTSASPRSIISVSGTTNLLFPHTQSISIYYIYYILKLITHLLPVFCIMNLNIVSWTLLCYFQSFIRVWFFWESRLQHKCTWWLQVLWKFWTIYSEHLDFIVY
jgi:hypothetical protein